MKSISLNQMSKIEGGLNCKSAWKLLDYAYSIKNCALIAYAWSAIQFLCPHGGDNAP